MIDPDHVRDRWLGLRDAAVVAELRRRCEAAAVEERSVPFSWWAYCPRPFPREMAGEDPRRGRLCQIARLGLDAAERPVFQRLRDDLFQLYDWSGVHCDVVEVNGSLAKLERFVFADGVLVEEISTGVHQRLDGRPAVEVMRWLYEDDRPSLAIETYESGGHPSWGGPKRGPYWGAKAYTFTYDAHGELLMITWFHGTRDFADGGDADDAQAAAWASFPQDFEARPLYDARTQRREIELPDPNRAYEGLAAPLADAIFAAVDQQRGALGQLEFVLVAPGRSLSQAVAADANFVARALRMTSGLREMLEIAAEAPQGTVLVDAIDAAPPDVLRRLRAGQQALAEQHGSTRAEDFQRDLVAALNARAWSGVAPTFVVLSTDEGDRGQHGDWEDDDELLSFPQEEIGHSGLPGLERIVGRERVGGFLERFAGRFEAAPAGDDLRPRSREELATLLLDVGLSGDEAARIAADALWGIVLEPGGTGVSRLGGGPVLLPDTPWPHADGRPLTHLATIALDELPAVDGREHLPDDGLLSFFADTSEQGEFVEPIEPSSETGRDLVAVIHTPAGATTHEPTPPGEILVEQRVSPVARLQLRHLGFGYGNRLFGIDALAERAVERLTERVNGAVNHQLLGYPWPVQDDPRKPGQLVLFHIADDTELEFSFIDAGDIHFLGTPEDIKARRWDQLTVVPNSC
jgi:Domain of unknown function (DUF1963)